MSASGRGACHSPERARARIMSSAFVFSVGPDRRRCVDRTRTPVSQGATLSGWPTPLPVIPAISRTTNGPSLGHSCPGCGVGQTVEDAPGERTAQCSMASSGSLGPALLGPTCQTAIRRTRPATGDFSTGSAPACCGASSKFSRRRSTTGYLDLQEAFIDGSFAPAKRGGACVGKTKRGKRSKIMAIADRQGRPVAVHVESATPHEVTLVHATLAERFLSQLPSASHRRQRLRVGQIGCRTGTPWRRTDCASPKDPDTADTRRSPAATLPTAMEGRTTLCLVAEFSADRRAL